MEGEAKENDLRPISDRISGAIRRFLFEDLRESWRNVWYNQIINVCWLLELKTLKVSVAILNSIRGETGSQ